MRVEHEKGVAWRPRGAMMVARTASTARDRDRRRRKTGPRTTISCGVRMIRDRIWYETPRAIEQHARDPGERRRCTADQDGGDHTHGTHRDDGQRDQPLPGIRPQYKVTLNVTHAKIAPFSVR
ncbi:hypothetical protein GCM10010191_74450 [Actinomadura vinacea]|uniref:Uncharacterized protein n=1 Tax=Actinomadura vinacea TaxID=115336 RepID=A0ABN3K163_9ACTN